MDEFITIAKALSDSNRVRTLHALRGGELCVCRIIALLGLAPSTVSKHMMVLKHAGLVTSRKQERWIYYRLSDSSHENKKVWSALEWIFNALSDDEQIISDAATMVGILRQNPEVLCKKRQEKKMSAKTRRTIQ